MARRGVAGKVKKGLFTTKTKGKQMTTKEILNQIANEHDGKLYPRDVVDFARPADSPLHSSFEWDDTVAAEKYRLAQAENIIRVQVTVIEHKRETIRAFVSLTSDRDKGFYRPIHTVMNNETLYSIAMNDALRELQSFRKKYSKFERFSGVIKEIEKLGA